jgi:hypothetical protein
MRVAVTSFSRSVESAVEMGAVTPRYLNDQPSQLRTRQMKAARAADVSYPFSVVIFVARNERTRTELGGCECGVVEVVGL